VVGLLLATLFQVLPPSVKNGWDALLAVAALVALLCWHAPSWAVGGVCALLGVALHPAIG
jgi:uncharacterized BrkB/YihY/UPF0761 family membrane protein